MDNIDEILKSKARNEKVDIPNGLDEKVEHILKTLPKKKEKGKYTRVASILVSMAIGTTVSVMAAPYIIELTGGKINYFKNSKDSKYTSDKPILEKYNGEIGSSITDKGITLTIDNIAIDDNFMNVFYTVKSEKNIPKVKGLFEHSSSSYVCPMLEYKINGEKITIINTYNTESYYESDKELKLMERINISQNKIDENFQIEISTKEVFGEKGDWSISLNLNKKEAVQNTFVASPEIKTTVSTGKHKHNINIEKVIISPLGNQIIISQKVSGENNLFIFSMFALQDDKGKFIDVIPGSVRYGGLNNVATNSFEFVNIDDDTEYLTLIPIIEDELYTPEVIKADISEINIKLKQSEMGHINIKDIDIKNNSISIKYKTEGVVPFLGGLDLLDENDQQIDLVSLMESSVDRETGIHTFTQIFNNATDEKINKIKKIGIFRQPFKLNYDEQIKIPLK